MEYMSAVLLMGERLCKGICQKKKDDLLKQSKQLCIYLVNNRSEVFFIF